VTFISVSSEVGDKDSAKKVLKLRRNNGHIVQLFQCKLTSASVIMRWSNAKAKHQNWRRRRVQSSFVCFLQPPRRWSASYTVADNADTKVGRSLSSQMLILNLQSS